MMLGDRNWNTKFRGVSPEYLEVKRYTIAEGSVFTDRDVAEANNVCMLGRTVRERLFGRDAAVVGQTVRVRNFLFLVVGVLSPKGQSAFGQDQDDMILVPYTTAQKKLLGSGHVWLDDILCSAVSTPAVDQAVKQVTALMRQRHGIQPGVEDDFNIRRPDEIIKAQLQAAETLATLLLSVASIALLVGGIGIMNVMLASVAQRTHEIGLRLAVGAKSSAVQLQFLGEAVMLSVFGGAMGVAFSFASADLVSRGLGWDISVPPQALLLAFGFSVVVGVFFGLYPARRASRLDPIEALRHE
jgi:putative ABC transport system permease protein